ncbi:hypothetical protein E1B28_005324 [Marasmius oreades]|uniref:Transmembrane protein n=1 Tax=Marasmius oreades TaxID=181124 RepID=A0A9P7V0D8_9AGAR|nr:uncharacterized protein E1B28_005324 [Marasmius oreades]KAG7098019.1 hypothetical protein E1B28_005324 [Marasmius oreades]
MSLPPLATLTVQHDHEVSASNIPVPPLKAAQYNTPDWTHVHHHDLQPVQNLDDVTIATNSECLLPLDFTPLGNGSTGFNTAGLFNRGAFENTENPTVRVGASATSSASGSIGGLISVGAFAIIIFGIWLHYRRTTRTSVSCSSTYRERKPPLSTSLISTAVSTQKDTGNTFRTWSSPGSPVTPDNATDTKLNPDFTHPSWRPNTLTTKRPRKSSASGSPVTPSFTHPSWRSNSLTTKGPRTSSTPDSPTPDNVGDTKLNVDFTHPSWRLKTLTTTGPRTNTTGSSVTPNDDPTVNADFTHPSWRLKSLTKTGPRISSAPGSPVAPNHVPVLNADFTHPSWRLNAITTEGARTSNTLGSPVTPAFTHPSWRSDTLATTEEPRTSSTPSSPVTPRLTALTMKGKGSTTPTSDISPPLTPDTPGNNQNIVLHALNFTHGSWRLIVNALRHLARV